MNNTRITIQLQKILDAIPSLPGDISKLPKELMLATAKDLCDQLRRSVRQQIRKLQQQADELDELQALFLQQQLEEQQRELLPKATTLANQQIAYPDNSGISNTAVLRASDGALQLHLHFHEQVGNLITHVDNLNTNE